MMVKIALYVAWFQSLMALIGSLYYSEIRHFVPCTLCWYQRILIYPLVIIIAVGIVRKDKKLYQYVLPFSVTGSLVALYQVLLQQGIIVSSAAPCSFGVSCALGYTKYFGFITIPMMSLAAFLLITACMVYVWRSQKR